jgi:hypothetical protein
MLRYEENHYDDKAMTTSSQNNQSSLDQAWSQTASHNKQVMSHTATWRQRAITSSTWHHDDTSDTGNWWRSCQYDNSYTLQVFISSLQIFFMLETGNIQWKLDLTLKTDGWEERNTVWTSSETVLTHKHHDSQSPWAPSRLPQQPQTQQHHFCCRPNSHWLPHCIEAKIGGKRLATSQGGSTNRTTSENGPPKRQQLYSPSRNCVTRNVLQHVSARRFH